MITNYNSYEIIDIAVQIEKNGKEFYTSAIALTKDKHLKLRLEKLAQWEDNHIAKIKELHKLCSEKEIPIIFPEIDPTAYLQSLETGHIFIHNPDIDAILKKTKNDRDILDIALTFEKDSVAFYNKIQTMNSDAQNVLEIIKKEEEDHVTFIEKLIQGL